MFNHWQDTTAQEPKKKSHQHFSSDETKCCTVQSLKQKRLENAEKRRSSGKGKQCFSCLANM